MAAVLAGTAGRSARAQETSGPRGEARLEVIAARHATVQLGAGVAVTAGPYMRVGLLAAGGATRRDDHTLATGRADAFLRFHLDPFRESRIGLYGIAGAGVMDDGSRTWEPRVFIGLGFEGRGGRRITPAVEAALGGGARLALALRGSRPGRR